MIADLIIVFLAGMITHKLFVSVRSFIDKQSIYNKGFKSGVEHSAELLGIAKDRVLTQGVSGSYILVSVNYNDFKDSK